MISANLSAVFYLISGILFILALRGLSSPDTSRQGNYFGIAGMVIAIVVTFLSVGSFSNGLIYVLIFLLVGGTELTKLFVYVSFGLVNISFVKPISTKLPLFITATRSAVSAITPMS